MAVSCPACGHPGVFLVTLLTGEKERSCGHGGRGHRTCRCLWWDRRQQKQQKQQQQEETKDK